MLNSESFPICLRRERSGADGSSVTRGECECDMMGVKSCDAGDR